MDTKKSFTLKEVEQLVKNAYNVGFSDGCEDCENPEFRDYRNEEDFWNKNVERWLTEEITYII